jgi:hypothetical protein
MAETVSAHRRELLERRDLGYAIHFVLDCTMDGNEGRTEPTDENLAHVLRSCARRPQPDEYARIRRHVHEYRAAQRTSREDSGSSPEAAQEAAKLAPGPFLLTTAPVPL